MMGKMRLAVFVVLGALLSINSGISSLISNGNDCVNESSKSLSPISVNDAYILFCTGHHGKNWSKIVVDSAGFHITNGTTRDWGEVTSDIPIDTIYFLMNNVRTIKWGIDSLLTEVERLKPEVDNSYNPIFYELSVVNNDNMILHNNHTKKYVGPSSDKFNQKLGALVYLMQWIASPSLRQYMPMPNDTLGVWTISR